MTNNKNTQITKEDEKAIAKINIAFIFQKYIVPLIRKNSVKKQIDYAEVGGAPLIGIKGCVIVSHGKSNPKAMENAIYQAIRYVDTGVNESIISRLQQLKQKEA